MGYYVRATELSAERASQERCDVDAGGYLTVAGHTEKLACVRAIPQLRLGGRYRDRMRRAGTLRRAQCRVHGERTVLECATAAEGYYVTPTRTVAPCQIQEHCETHASYCSRRAEAAQKLICTEASVGFYLAFGVVYGPCVSGAMHPGSTRMLGVHGFEDKRACAAADVGYVLENGCSGSMLRAGPLRDARF